MATSPDEQLTNHAAIQKGEQEVKDKGTLQKKRPITALLRLTRFISSDPCKIVTAVAGNIANGTGVVW